MKSIQVIVYVSTATQRMSEEELARLLVDARAFNAQHGVTGALLHHGGNFFRSIEWPSDGMALVYERIRASRRHHGLVELVNQHVPHRHFAAWQMGFANVPKDTILAFSHATWERVAGADVSPAPENEGVPLLLQFWRGVKQTL
jgi:hypothetical protein